MLRFLYLLSAELTAIVLFFNIPSAFAQHKGFQADLSAGILNTNIREGSDKVGSALTNPYGGLTLTSPTLALSDSNRSLSNLRLSLSPYYGVMGADFNTPRYKHKFHYLNVPLMVRIKAFQYFDIIAGASTAFLVTEFLTEKTGNPEKAIKEPPYLHTFGVAGVEIPIVKRLGLQFNYQHSLKPLTNDFRFSGIQVGLNYQLNAGKRDQAPWQKTDSKAEQKAKAHIKALRSGILLVRLKAKKIQLKALKDRKKRIKKALENTEQSPEKAEIQDRFNEVSNEIETLKRKTKKRHQKIIKAFHKNFDFSEVAFFYNHRTEAMLTDKWHKSAFQKLDQKHDFKDKNKTRYILDLGSSFLKRQNKRFEGMVIRDTSLKVLREPFPAKHPNTKTFSFIDLEKDVSKMVRKLNETLKSFYYKQVNKPIPKD